MNRTAWGTILVTHLIRYVDDGSGLTQTTVLTQLSPTESNKKIQVCRRFCRYDTYGLQMMCCVDRGTDPFPS